ncbi:CRAL/TRIO domain-containing protein [Hyaloscypha variabilis F]|uniref:Phosphatidylinositol transfer protein SFH5 n=1 Tax=Hyaloscypha variabilis (strain UAMH 11265 / GT02V1 / F) TaxID=1149755 RepID=A0A2J6RFS6_HYAVF|nr:CRAL/TRIO domain-containing protein [Hyaloscypha variabilis F]
MSAEPAAVVATATEPVPGAEEASVEATEKPASPPSSPLSKLFAELPSIVEAVQYTEMWGVQLTNSSDIPSSIVLEKFLRANNQDVAKAKAQLAEALLWRKEVQPQKRLAETEFSESKFGGLGYVTVYPKTESHEKEIVTWNIYGAVKDKQETFGNAEEFVKWRAALMELSLKELDLASATEPIPPNGVDPYRMVQVHDYLNVSFLRMDPNVKAASKEVIQTFSMAYPELVKEKFFVNVPLLMGWVFAAMKLFLSPETVKKFHPLSYGSSLAGELPGWGQELPVAYGGKGKDVKEGLTVKYGAVAQVEEPVKDETK